MKHIDLVRTLESTFSPPLLDLLSGKFGLSPTILRDVVAHATLALVAALMAESSTGHGTSAVFTAIMSSEVNARIAEQFEAQVSTTTGLKSLETAGQALAAHGSNVSLADMSDYVAAQAGVPTQAAYAMTGLITVALFGILKHYVLLEQGSLNELPQLFAAQWPAIESKLSDPLAGLLGFDDAAAFRDIVPAQLRVLSGNLQRAASQHSATMPEGGASGKPVTGETAPVPGKAGSGRWHKVGFASIGLAICAVAVVYADHYSYQIPLLTDAARDKSTQTVSHPSAPPAFSASGNGVRPASAPLPATPDSSASITPASTTVALTPGTVSSIVASNSSGASSPSSASQMSAAQKTDPRRLVFGVNRVGAAILSATVASETEKTRLLEVLERQLGAGHYTADLMVDSQVTPEDWSTRVEAFVPLMRIARADMTIEGQDIELGGAAGEPGLGWAARIRQLFGPSFKVSVFNPADAVSAATAKFQVAAANQSRIGSCDDVEHVLSLQVIDFASGSGHIPSSAIENLRKSAQLLKVCAGRRQLVRLTIESFSDNIGDARANLDLSTKRAEAVREFLVQAGVSSNLLVAHGYGVDRPIASNMTERGRFANRRIVFVSAG